ncbi:diguanylate cyclase (GGDEF)-like protein [Maritalea mobilis]|uniref:Diguanylate cyclase (GGDEF)-like protein n=1 Tax=Maritalea mobilis TaxID=483324 RepID=A0A4R6VQB6_9HYPH|nr:EAL domain-containing protein [Maritalea mobilis]TDQ61837.1 diguanylate cyclase (GGDEF)-like protein [Maritalea mobilis]
MKINWKSKKLYLAVGVTAIAAIAACIYAMSTILNHMLLEDARADGVAWADNAATQTHQIERLLESEANFSLTERILRQLRDVGNIYSVQFISPTGEVRFEANQFHAEETAGLVADHEHDDHWTEGGTQFVEALVGPHMHVDGTFHQNLVHTLSVDLASHTVRLGTGDGHREPLHFAEVNHPVLKDGILQYALRVRVDQTERFILFQTAIWEISLLLGATALFVVGVPAYLSVRSRKEADLADQRAHYLAKHDSMTGLDNRNNFLTKLEYSCNNSQRGGEKLALIAIDVDGFKEINDGYGHDVGDELLVQFSAQLKYECEDFRSIARIGGDEFACYTRFDDEAEMRDFIDNLQKALSHPYEIKDHNLIATVSVGAAFYPTDAKDVTDLMKKADIALYAAKTDGRNGHAIFDQAMEQDIADRRVLEALIRHATQHHSFDLYFQPLYCGRRHEPCGFEALMRLQDQSGQFVSPEKFIPIAEEMGIMEELGEAILQKAATAAMKWPSHLRLAVNLSAVQFESGSLIERVKAVLARTGLPADRLELEITESLLMQNTKRNLRQLNEIKALGVSIAMDDFGTGYSSLGYLWQFPFDKIKIDRSFLGGDENSNEKAMQVISTIIALGHSLEMHVTAEGVETESQVAMLNKLECDQLQGFYLGRPTPEAELSKYWDDEEQDKSALEAV